MRAQLSALKGHNENVLEGCGMKLNEERWKDALMGNEMSARRHSVEKKKNGGSVEGKKIRTRSAKTQIFRNKSAN